MKNFIVKTALITLASVIATALVSFTVLTVYSPRTVANLAYSLGSERVALWYEELTFQKSDKVSDLKTLFERSAEFKNNEYLVKYSKMLIEHDEFDAVCAADDEKNYNEANGNNIKYKNFVYGNYAVALYKTGASHTEIFAVADVTVEDEYSKHNAYQSLIYGSGATEDKAFLTAIKEKLSELAEKFGESVIAADLAAVDNMLAG